MKEDARHEAEMVRLRHIMETLVCEANGLAVRHHDMIKSVFWKDNWTVLDES